MRTAAAAGVGYTALSKASGRSVLDLAAEATRAAAEDAGLPLSEVDGVVSFSVLNDSVSSAGGGRRRSHSPSCASSWTSSRAASRRRS